MSNIAANPRVLAAPPRGTCRVAGAVFPYPHRTVEETDQCPRCYGTSVKWQVDVCKRCGNSGKIS